jgi:hypothetical protein
MRQYRIIIWDNPNETIIGQYDTREEVEENIRPYLYNPGLRLDFWFGERWVRGWHHSQYPRE